MTDPTNETTEATPTVEVRQDQRIGRILLNRPKALNALDLPMIRAVAAALDAWRDDPAIHAVVIEGAGGRAFCAGGDIRAIRALSLAGEGEAIETFFAEEYALNLAIARFPKPYVALIDGICMGGGIGLSVHGGIRVASEAAMLAMPETAIGFFPDVGTTFVLPRLPGRLGMYLGLTGTRLHGADAVFAGLATHFVPHADMPALSEALAADGVAALAAFTRTPEPPFTLAPHRSAIEHCFGAPDLPSIVRRLEAEATDDPSQEAWCAATLASLRAMSPSALATSLAVIRDGGGRTLEQCLQAELSLTRSVTRHPDFLEGVRAMVVDKDRNPAWLPPAIEDLPPARNV